MEVAVFAIEMSVLGSRPRGVGLVILLLVLSGCGSGSTENGSPSEVVDVEEPIGEISILDDPKAEAPKPSLMGVLPSSHPEDLPLLLPASLVDFGTVDDGWKSVSLLSDQPAGAVEDALRGLLRDAGWQLGEGQANTQQSNTWPLLKGERRARLKVEPANPGTVYRYEYPAGSASKTPGSG